MSLSAPFSATSGYSGSSGEYARVLTFPQPGIVDMQTAQLRRLGDDEVMIETRYSSIAGWSERAVFQGRLPGGGTPRFPLVPGSEAAGIVTAAGKDVGDLRVGDEVFVGGAPCFAELASFYGGQSSTLIKKASQVVLLQGVPVQHAPLLAIAAAAVHGVARLGTVAGKRIGVVGLGALGQLAARFLQARGAHVVAADARADRLAVAPGERVDLARNALDDVERNLDAVIEATGDSQEIARCARALRPHGAIVALSYYDELNLPYPELYFKEVGLLVAREFAGVNLLVARDAFANGTVDPSALASFVLPVDEYERGYRTAFEDPSVLKVIFAWT